MHLFLLFSTRHMFIIITVFFICATIVFSDSVFVSPGCDNPMSESLLTEREHLRMNVVCLLCRWCSHERETTSGSGHGGALTPTGVKKRLLNMLDEETGWDPIHPFDLQMVRAINAIVKLN